MTIRLSVACAAAMAICEDTVERQGAPCVCRSCRGLPALALIIAVPALPLMVSAPI